MFVGYCVHNSVSHGDKFILSSPNIVEFLKKYVGKHSKDMVKYFQTYPDKRYCVLHEHFLTIRHVLRFMGHKGGIKARDQRLGWHSDENRAATGRRNQALIDANEHPFQQKKKGQVSWKKRFEELKAFKVEHGHCNVPEGYEDNPKLGTWVTRQRTQYRFRKEGKKSSITDERVAKLVKLDFKWSLNVPWEETFEQLKAFKAEHEHCNVPQSYKDNPKLGKWVDKQRYQYRLRNDGKKSQITDDRVTKLNELGFVWRF